MIEVTRTGRRGALTGISIECDSVEQAEGLASMSTYWRVYGVRVYGHGSKKDVAKIESAVDTINTESAKKINATATGKIERVMVPAGKYKIGDVINGNAITGFGVEFQPNIDQHSANGIEPWVETVCYAYFN